MKGYLLLLFVGWWVTCGCVAPVGAESHLMRYADVHEDQIVFTYEGDLWLVSSEGGDARRITNDRGSEWSAKFSPDGSKLAFTAQYDGGTDIYVMDARGGVPGRLTYHPAMDRMLDWFPDGQRILFRSTRDRAYRGEELFSISLKGGMPEKLPVDRAGPATISPDGKKIAYNRLSSESRTWKRYYGGWAQDVWVGSLDKGDYQRITKWKGADNWPMWQGEAIYFNSDRREGTLNIHRYDTKSGAIRALTHYGDYDVKYPSVGPGKIVYQYAESLHLLDLATGKTRLVEVNIPSDLAKMRAKYVDVKANTGSFSLSPSGKRMLLESRGEIINVPVKKGDPINLTHSSGTREKNGAWSPDGRWVAFISDQSGEEEVYLVDQRGEQEWRQLTSGGLGFRMQPVWSPDSKYLLFHDKFMRLNLVEVESGELTVIDQGEYDDAWERWGIQDYVWSPGSRWVAYTKMEQSLTESVFLYSLDSGESTRVTDMMTNEWSPSFDPGGKYLYFLSHRTFNPIMCFADQNHMFLDMCLPYAVVLQAGEASPFAPEDSAEEVAEDEAGEDEEGRDEEEAGEEKEEDEEGEGEKKEAEPTKIDLQGLERRTVVVEGVEPGNYFRLEGIEGGFCYLAKTEPEFSKYQSVTDQTSGSLKLCKYDLKEKKSSEVMSGLANYHLSADGKKLVYRAEGKYGVVDTGAESKVGDGEVELGEVRIKIDRQEEFLQMFDEAWRVERDWFYDAGMHGVDWEAVREKYRRFVGYCGNRSDLNYLIGEMIAELSAGHTYVWGGDYEEPTAERIPTGLLGVEFETVPGAEYQRLAHIIPGRNWEAKARSPLYAADCPVKEGDYLIGIDGEEVGGTDNVYRHLENKADKVVTLRYNSEPSAEGAKTYRVRTIGSERAIRYGQWVEKNRSKADEASGGRIGYVHLPDMGQAGLIEFAKAFYPQHFKGGLIIDVRYNNGGFVGDMIIDRLERKLWSLTQPREGKPIRDPERNFHGHLVVIINEDTASNGEYFAEAIKIKGLAPLLGMRTWGGAVGVEPHQDLVDGGTVTPPQFAPIGLDGRWLIEGHGVDPDIEVQNLPAEVLEGKDAQLEAAIEYLLKKMEEEPMLLPERPTYPDRSRRAARSRG